MSKGCISVSCPRCGLISTDFVNDALRKQLDVAVGGLEELRDTMHEHSIFVCGVFTIVQDTLGKLRGLGR